MPKWTRYLPKELNPKQIAFLLYEGREALYGGAAGGGKSWALLAAALQYVDEPGYDALLLRRSYADLTLPRSLMDIADEWLRPTDARYRASEKRWIFPSGASLSFGYLATEDDKYRYQSAGFQFIGFDELTQFQESQYRYLFSRLRRSANARVPLRMRAATNPGGQGNDWVHRRFILEGRAHGRVFMPAMLADNPKLDAQSYIEMLGELDPVTRQQLLQGVWGLKPDGNMFRRAWFEIVKDVPEGLRLVRYWDLAATKPKRGKDPDFTAGTLLGMDRKNREYYVLDVVRFQDTPGEVEKRIKQVAQLDRSTYGHHMIRMEQEGGSSGLGQIEHYSRNVLDGYDFRGIPSSGDKVLRAGPFSSASEAGRVKLLQGKWIGEWFDELEPFPGSGHDDQVDSASGAYNSLAKGANGIADGSTNSSPVSDRTGYGGFGHG